MICFRAAGPKEKAAWDSIKEWASQAPLRSAVAENLFYVLLTGNTRPVSNRNKELHSDVITAVWCHFDMFRDAKLHLLTKGDVWTSGYLVRRLATMLRASYNSDPYTVAKIQAAKAKKRQQQLCAIIDSSEYSLKRLPPAKRTLLEIMYDQIKLDALTSLLKQIPLGNDPRRTKLLRGQLLNLHDELIRMLVPGLDTEFYEDWAENALRCWLSEDHEPMILACDESDSMIYSEEPCGDTQAKALAIQLAQIGYKYTFVGFTSNQVRQVDVDRPEDLWEVLTGYLYGGTSYDYIINWLTQFPRKKILLVTDGQGPLSARGLELTQDLKITGVLTGDNDQPFPGTWTWLQDLRVEDASSTR